MDKKNFIYVFSFAVVALALAIFLPGGRTPDPNPKLPWNISADGQGNLSVFGLTLGTSTLQEARQRFNDEGKVSLFINQDDELTLEAYFERIYLNGLKADFVLILESDPDTLQSLYDKGSRISRTTDQIRKVNLSSEDMLFVSQLPIRAINYIPSANLEESLIERRFGTPLERIEEPETGIIHLVYPENGLSIALDPEGKELLQYVKPEDYDLLLATIKQGETN
jgi:hypothetical protein